MNRAPSFIVFAILIAAGAGWVFMKIRLDPVESSTQPSSVVSAEQGRVAPPQLPGGAMDLIQATAKMAKPAEPVRSNVASRAGQPVVRGEDWEGALQDVTAVNAELAGIEKMATKSGLLPEATVIEASFAELDQKLTALKSRELASTQRDEIRTTLKKSADPALVRIHEALANRPENQLVHAAQIGLAQVMESIQGL